MSIFTGLAITGINCDDTNCPPQIIKYLTYRAVRQDFGVFDPLPTYLANVNAQIAAGLKVLCTVHSQGQAFAVHQALGDRVDIEYKNEINLQTLASGANQDFTLLGDYLHECQWLADNGIKCWIGCMSTALDEPTVRNTVRSLGNIALSHHGIAWHGYGNNPGFIANGVAAMRKYWAGPMLMTEWSPQPFIQDAVARAAWHYAAKKDFEANRMTGFTYRLIDGDIGTPDFSGLVTNTNWSATGYQINDAGKAFKVLVTPSLRSS